MQPSSWSPETNILASCFYYKSEPQRQLGIGPLMSLAGRWGGALRASCHGPSCTGPLRGPVSSGRGGSPQLVPSRCLLGPQLVPSRCLLGPRSPWVSGSTFPLGPESQPSTGFFTRCLCVVPLPTGRLCCGQRFRIAAGSARVCPDGAGEGPQQLRSAPSSAGHVPSPYRASKSLSGNNLNN